MTKPSRALSCLVVTTPGSRGRRGLTRHGRPRHQSRRGDADAHSQGRDRGAEGCSPPARTGARVCQRPSVYAVCSRYGVQQARRTRKSQQRLTATQAPIRLRPRARIGGPWRQCPGAARPRQPGGPARPQDWDEIGIGSVVLATVGVEDGWWESIVIGVNADAFSLKWRDFPREPVFVRRRTELALLPAAAK